jgi:hypothetical protein
VVVMDAAGQEFRRHGKYVRPVGNARRQVIWVNHGIAGRISSSPATGGKRKTSKGLGAIAHGP